jgi:hypothetical protein
MRRLQVTNEQLEAQLAASQNRESAAATVLESLKSRVELVEKSVATHGGHGTVDSSGLSSQLRNLTLDSNGAAGCASSPVTTAFLAESINSVRAQSDDTLSQVTNSLIFFLKLDCV